MSVVHLSTPADPQSAACGDRGASRFTFWRWKCTCATCKMVTGARAFDAQRTKGVTFRADLPIRYSALVAHVRRLAVPGVAVALEELERDRRVAARCARHGTLADPIAMFDVVANRVVFACPECTTGEAREQWEREGY